MMKSKRGLITAAAGVLLTLSAAGCGAQASDDDTGDSTDTIRLGLAPAEDSATVLTKFTPFIDYLSETTGLEIEPYVGADYTAVIEALNSGHLDVAWFGPSEYTLATDTVDGGVEAFASAVQAEGTETYRTSFLVRADSGIEDVEDFEGRTVAFTDPASTSGHIFGRYALEEEGHDPEELFSQIIYSGSHDASLLSLVNGQVDVAAISSRLLPEFIESGMAEEDDIEIVFESEEIPADPITYREDLPQDVKDALSSALLSGDPEIADSLDGTGFGGFAEADDSAYDIVRRAYEAAGMEPEL
ncbi:phosphate/phosphite/phosphonate ABC transporter substrate-binding protein [Aeromicrobium sp. PE09-221]|uniref:phosphate/phosphite/phosphonate ABC transporter substrate-binding protein n=1 Tax=Aeromicrobium sp. PE09-221 TaxID=1898043 RepID=UPI001483B4C0|nr:phosphate/phosphite/phosphonate ABC transporter substrate-binding protein [Aeromicrobium sp. PE09-221]